jgi:hypothetical protein
VVGLVDTIPHERNYVIVADSFYGSLELAEALHAKGWAFILACRGDRPTPLFNGKLALGLKRGEWRHLTNEEQSILAMCFHDIKKVIFSERIYKGSKYVLLKGELPNKRSGRSI